MKKVVAYALGKIMTSSWYYRIMPEVNTSKCEHALNAALTAVRITSFMLAESKRSASCCSPEMNAANHVLEFRVIKPA